MLLANTWGLPVAMGQTPFDIPGSGTPERVASIAKASPSSAQVYPVDPKSSIGVAVTIDVRRWQTPGQLWVDIAIASSKVMTADRHFELRFNPCPPGSVPQIRSSWIKSELTLPQGLRLATKTVHLPCYCLASGLTFELIENGAVPEGYSDTIPNPNWDRRKPLQRMFDEHATFDLLTLEASADWNSLSWKSLDSYDIVHLSDDLGDKLNDAPIQNVLTDYLLCGGTILLGDELSIDRVSLALNVRPLETRQTTEAVSRADAGSNWTVRSVGAGQIIQGPFGSQSQGKIATDDTAQTLSQIIPLRSSPILRHGVDPMLGDSRFFQWVVPGVAQPPVYAFMGLLTVFVILVGPVAYRRTARYGRSYLIFAIAPVLALITTIAMFAYGILADGFGTQASIRQITYVDGQSGHAGERIRGAYFSGIRPQSGLHFDLNASVLPYPESTNRSWESLRAETNVRPGLIELDSDQQRFDSSFLPSRQQREFVMTRPVRDLGRLRFHDHDGPQATSEFKFDLRRVVICDSTGKKWIVDELPGGQTVKCVAPQPQSEIPQKLGGMYNDFWLTGQTRQARTYAQNNRLEMRDLIANLNQRVGATTVIVDGIFEDLLINTMKNNPSLLPGTFVAMADVSEDTIAVPGAELKKSVRYIMGTLPK